MSLGRDSTIRNDPDQKSSSFKAKGSRKIYFLFLSAKSFTKEFKFAILKSVKKLRGKHKYAFHEGN
jgi:hypothetical protein